MLKKTIKYVDFNEEEVTEEFYFNLTTPEITKMIAKIGDDIDKYAEKLAASGDYEKIIDFVEMLILTSYGVKSEDGKRFVKSKEARENFEYSAAYAELFEQLMTDPEQSKAFGQGLMRGAKAK